MSRVEPDLRPVRCPEDGITAGEDGELAGCGGVNLAWDGIEAWDCGDCGLFIFPNAEGVEFAPRNEVDTST